MPGLFPQFRGGLLASAEGWTASFAPVRRSENPLAISRPGHHLPCYRVGDVRGLPGGRSKIEHSSGTCRTEHHWPPATGHENHPSRPADILSDMDSRASDKIPGARVRVKRYVPAQSSSGARPREWLALADGALQEAKTEGPVLALVGEPLPYQPGRAERRSGVPAEVITSDHVPNSCTCSWAYSQGKLTLKHYNAACPVHPPTLGH